MSGRTTSLALPFAIAALVGAAAPAAMAQAVSTANSQGAPISQEQFLQLMGRLDAMEKRNGELEAQVQALKSAVPPAPKPETVPARASLRDGRPTLTAGDEFTASIRALVQLDAGFHDQGSAGPLTTDFRRGSLGSADEAERARNLSDGANFRRVRFGVDGRLWSDWNYYLLLDAGGSGTEESARILNAYLEYGGAKPLRFRIGAFSPSTSLDDGTTPAQSLFLERPAPAELVRAQTGGDGRTGAAVLANGDRWFAFAGVTGNSVQTVSLDDQVGAVGRLAFLPLKTGNGLVHLGANANLVLDPAADGLDATGAEEFTPLRLRERPEIRLDSTRLIDTGSIDASGFSSYGLELGLQWKALSLQAEHFWLEVDRRASPLADPKFRAWYVQAAWTITKQPRRYNAATAGFEGPKVEEPFNLKAGRWGVWELAARWTDTDLNSRAGADGTTPVPGAVRGGRQEILTLGLNWYPNNNVRFLAGYQHVDVDRLSLGGAAFGAGALTPPAGAQVGQDLDVWSLRTQYSF